MKVRQKTDKGSTLGSRRRHAIIKKQQTCTYPILSIILLVHHVWGLSSAVPFSLDTAHMVPPPMLNAGKTHMQPRLEIIFKAAEKLLRQTACQSVFLPRETTSALLLTQPTTFFSSGYGLGAAADTVCSFKATLLPPHEYRPKVKNWLSGELVAKPLTASRLMYGLQITSLIAMVVLIVVGTWMSYTSPETDGLFHSAAALLYVLYCMDLFLGQQKLDMVLIAVVLFPQLGMLAVMQLAAVVAPLLLVVLYAAWAVTCRVSALVVLLDGLWQMSPVVMTALLTIAMMICYLMARRQTCCLLGAVFSLLFMAMFSNFVFAESAGVWCYIRANSTELLHRSMQLWFKCAPVWIAVAKPLTCLSVLRFVGLPTLQFFSDTLFSEEKVPVERLVSIARVYTSMGMLFICCSEHMAQSLLLLLLLKAGVEPNPGPAMNILAICAMMVLSPRPRNSLELAGGVVSASVFLLVTQLMGFYAVLRCHRPDVQQRFEISRCLLDIYAF